ncbi:MAG: hypothetical protein M1148_01925 [Candidatus Thermoplasmatota archaeon]|nr:hypothetical protein [Candidatus Thermoplasmatota archaeon]
MNTDLYYYFLILVFLGSTVTSTVLAFIHIYYGSKDIRNIRSGSYLTPFISKRNVKVLHTILGTDSAFVLSVASVIDVLSFLLFVYLVGSTTTFTNSFYYYAGLMVLITLVLLVKISRDVFLSKISAIRYELTSEDGAKPELDFVPDIMFKPLRSLITKNSLSNGSTRVGFVSSERRKLSAVGDKVEFKESVELRNQSSTNSAGIKSLNVSTPGIDVVRVVPTLPAIVEPSGSVSLTVTYSVEKSILKGIMEVHILSLPGQGATTKIET